MPAGPIEPVTLPGPPALHAALRQLEPRHAQVLGMRFIQGRSSAEVAAHFGVPQEALDILTLRATLALQAALGTTGPAEPEPSRERQLAQSLRESLEGSGASLAATAGWERLLRALEQHAQTLQQMEEQSVREEESSGRASRRELMRRGFILLLLGVTLLLYLQRPP